MLKQLMSAGGSERSMDKVKIKCPCKIMYLLPPEPYNMEHNCCLHMQANTLKCEKHKDRHADGLTDNAEVVPASTYFGGQQKKNPVHI